MRKLIFYIIIFGIPFCLKAQSSVSVTQSVSTAWGSFVKTGIAAYGNTLLQITMEGQNSAWHGLFAVNGTNSWTPNITWNNISLLSWSGYNSATDDVQALIMSNTPANSFGGTEIVIKIGSPTSGSGILKITATGENASQLSMSSYSYSPLSYTMTSSQGTYNVYQNNNNLGIGLLDPSYGGTVGSKLTVSQSDGGTGFCVGNGVTPRFALNGQSNGSWTMYDFATNSWTAGITQSLGNIGIGTTSPTEKLSVNGNIRSKKLIVTQNGWSDYVFNDGYHLRPLAQVENFIKENKHLPEVPTTKEVAEKGVDVGETQALLLKKIEELTLYMIEMKKENEKMKNGFENEIKELKQQMSKRK